MDNFKKQEIKERLPLLIEEAGLEINKKFTITNGGEFKCPVCGKTIKLYRSKMGAHNWAINGLGHCTCFNNGKYFADSFGFYSATHNCSNLEAIEALTGEKIHKKGERGGNSKLYKKEYTAEEKKDYAQKKQAEKIEMAKKLEVINDKKREEKALRTEREEENIERIIKSTHWGKNERTDALLMARGIITLPTVTYATIGATDCNNVISFSTGKEYEVKGLTFRLSSGAMQTRKCNADWSYINKEQKAPRFVSFGKATPYYTNGRNTAAERFEVVFEGGFDALTAQACGLNATALIGAGNKEAFIADVKNKSNRDEKKQIYILNLDRDDAGKMSENRLKEELDSFENVITFVTHLEGNYHDINDRLKEDKTHLEIRCNILSRMISLYRNCKLTREQIQKTIDSINIADNNKNYEFFNKVTKRLDFVEFGKMGD